MDLIKEQSQLNLDLFPITKTDAQIEKTKSNIDRAIKSVEDLKGYKEYLARKYDIVADVEEANKCSRQSIYCPTFTSLEVDEDNQAAEDEDVFHWHSDETRARSSRF